MKIIVFGAGKIGRSFIGHVFSRSGYEVVFADIDKTVIGALNTHRAYDVVVKDTDQRTIRIENVRGIDASDTSLVAGEVASADIIAVSVGKNALRHIIPTIAAGLLLRFRENPRNPLDIIIAENMRDSDLFIKESLTQHLPGDYPVDELVGLVETSIGKMVPIMHAGVQDDPLTVHAEAYNSLIVSKKGFKNPLPDVEDLAPKENIKAWVDRKLFIHNMGHSAAAYLGNRLMPETEKLCEVLANRRIERQVREIMRQSADILLKLYPQDFTSEDLDAHIDELITRFKNPHLDDTVYRVGSDLPRKLRTDDRMLVPVVTGERLGMPYGKILGAFVAGMHFDARDADGNPHPGDSDFRRSLEENGILHTLINLCMLDNESDKTIIERIESRFRSGIISMGTWLVDIVKFIDSYPQPGNLTTIRDIRIGGGGCSHNVLIDLAKLGAGLPLYGGGCVGSDANGRFLLDEMIKNGIDASLMTVLEDVHTSYTDVMTEARGGGRTFFHYRGANALLGPEHFENIDIPARIFHLGYLLLMDRMDEPDREYGRVAARVLDSLQKRGYKTSVDVVSEEGDRFREVVLPSLPYIDYLIVNEVESGACCGMELRDAKGEIILDHVREAACRLLDLGVREQVVIHFPEGGYARNKAGESCYEPTLMVQADDLLSSVGAGDAFCAGMLYALHEDLPLREGLILANVSARFNLFDATSTGGAPAMRIIEEFIKDNY